MDPTEEMYKAREQRDEALDDAEKAWAEVERWENWWRDHGSKALNHYATRAEAAEKELRQLKKVPHG